MFPIVDSINLAQTNFHPFSYAVNYSFCFLLVVLVARRVLIFQHLLSVVGIYYPISRKRNSIVATADMQGCSCHVATAAIRGRVETLKWS